mmetsp:Transcript_29914/g.77484  ORF Transcript_29914/g.77484 Transcript_29914/m.77484 type:complete len:278 (+) Transcript_29914:495-1328(+)
MVTPTSGVSILSKSVWSTSAGAASRMAISISTRTVSSAPLHPPLALHQLGKAHRSNSLSTGGHRQVRRMTSLECPLGLLHTAATAVHRPRSHPARNITMMPRQCAMRRRVPQLWESMDVGCTHRPESIAMIRRTPLTLARCTQRMPRRRRPGRSGYNTTSRLENGTRLRSSSSPLKSARTLSISWRRSGASVTWEAAIQANGLWRASGAAALLVAGRRRHHQRPSLSMTTTVCSRQIPQWCCGMEQDSLDGVNVSYQAMLATGRSMRPRAMKGEIAV